MATISNDWMVTFIYAQDLRSYYMNGLLNAGFRPGIYNADLSLFTVTERDAASYNDKAGIYLHIKKGSTFIFSNSYKLKNGVYERDFENIGTYLIKCVALHDISQPLITWEADESSRQPVSIAMLGPDRADKHYVVAKLCYNKESENEGGVPGVIFTVVQPNSTYNTPEAASYKDNIYFVQPYPVNNPPSDKDIEAQALKLPDGSANYFSGASEAMTYISWLCLGAVFEKESTYKGPYKINSYLDASSTKWNPSSGAQSWIRNHVFTARGIPDYRQTLVAESVHATPDLIIDSQSSNIYPDTGYMFDGDIVHYTSNDWKGVQGIGGSGSIGGEHYSFAFKENESLDNFAATLDSKSANEMLIVDAVMLSSINRTSSNNQTVKDLFTRSNSIGTKLIGYRWAAQAVSGDTSAGNFAPAFDIEADFNTVDFSRIKHKNFSYNEDSLKGQLIAPLDVCRANLDRLLSIVRGKSIIPSLVNYLRQTTSLGLDAQETTSLIPLCLAFRKFKKMALPGAEAATWVAVDDFSSTKQVHPANILSFFDLQYKTTKVASTMFSSKDIYTILPVID